MRDSSRSEVSLWYKYILFFTCFILFLCTGGVSAVVSYYLSTREDLKINSVLEFFLDWSCVILVFSSLLFVMTFFGWLGALREYRTSLLIFEIILCFLMLLEVIVLIIVFLLSFNEGFRKLAYDEDTYQEAIRNYRDPRFESLHETIDSVQESLKCCGVSNNEEGYKDWTVNEYFNCSSQIPEARRSKDYCSVPHTCCIKKGTYVNVLCGQSMADPNTDEATRSATIYTKGCFLALTELIQKNIMWIGIVCISILIPQVILNRISSGLRYQILIQRKKWSAQQANFDRISIR